MHRLLILAAMALSALASEVGASCRCAWTGMPGQCRVEKVERRRAPKDE